MRLNKQAFTMIELIVVIVILGIVSGLGIEVIKFSYDNERRVRALNELEIKSQVAVDFISTHLNNSIKNSFRLKKESTSDCTNSIHDCRFVFNITNPISLKDDYKIFEWARIDLLDRKKEYWDGINDTKAILDEIIDKNDCYNNNTFKCFVNYKANTKTHTMEGINKKIAKSADKDSEFLNKQFGLYFLGDNIANSTSFIEKDLYTLIIKKNAGAIESEVELKLSDKNFTMSNAYVLVDNIEGIYFDIDNTMTGGDKLGKILFYSIPWADMIKNKFKVDIIKDAHLLIDEVSKFNISNINGVTRFKICLKRDNLPGSMIHTKHSIEVCKTGVVI